MKELIAKIVNRILDKLFSARYIITILLTITFCYLAVKEKIGVEAFAAIFGIIIRDYFERKDRRKPNEENGSSDNGGTA